MLSDLTTPVSLYLRLRNHFKDSLLLESSDYRASENSFSYLCIDPLSSISLRDGILAERRFNHPVQTRTISGRHAITRALESYIDQFAVKKTATIPGVVNGIFGYLSFDAISSIEEITLQGAAGATEAIPQMHYALYRFVIAINHFKDEMFILENKPSEEKDFRTRDLLALLSQEPAPMARFRRVGSECSNMTDEQHSALISRCQDHIRRGDVFQIVPSRKFSQAYSGDDFQVYRALRSLNPSPYLFYFDYGAFRIFGSSPEAQIVVQNGRASIFPIAGTYRRSGDDNIDAERARALLGDPKENAEHVMLVDLARNDLSIYCHPVEVESFREVQFYSHVIHLVSKVSGQLREGSSAIEVLTSTFPAGTLTGAPKYKAMELLDRYEPGRRHYYGGALGLIGFDRSCNHAIMIRSFLSQNGILHSQGGSGVVADSVAASEVAEVNNKLGALRAALVCAEELE